MKRGLIHHIEIYVSDFERSTDFWGWLLESLGYCVHQQWELGMSWKLGDTYLVFVQTEDRYLDVAYHRKRTGLNHLAFYADSREHVDQLTQQLKGQGVTVLYEDDHPYAGGDSHYAVYFEDPDRMKVEVVAPE
ncbi:VOC family protein [Geomicrobium sp. JCM 19038]|uniref:VOC family protein n=1 Tax=Geomicrobium sp. JCM 19038 TaxID=1460635 RepID=UPI00045F4BC7|nr:VOC family protein [Geomicrobium sp. JCM 19038]EZH65298.1 hypothetical protein DH09_16805 [Bacillaceae bacterium JMAK1]GAK09499.1 hypothetical protein JCM19038_3338 [Geomicrobium sp. JCM 19038]